MTYLLLTLAVLLSYGFVYFTKPKQSSGLRLLLAFSGAFLLALTVFELLPAVYEATNPRQIGIFIMLGILLQIFLEFFSKGLEHGHFPPEEEGQRVPWLILLSLCLHALLEGIPLAKNEPIFYGIMVHKIPIALVLSIFLVSSRLSTAKSLGIIIAFSAMTPLGMLMAKSIPWVQELYEPLSAMVIGIFLHISAVILFESSKGHQFNLRKLLVIILGIGLAYLL